MLGLMLVVCGLAAAWALPAQAYVYWTNGGVGNSSNGTTVGRINSDGSGRNHALVTSASGPTGIVVDAGHMYWSNTQTNSIGRASLGGAGAQPSFIPGATSGSSSAPAGIALDGGYIYWADGIRYIGRAKLDGTGAVPHFIDAGPSTYPIGIAVSSGTLYIADFDSILHVSVSGGTPQTLVALPAGATPTSLTAASGYLYWSALNLGQPSPSGTIGRALLNGSALDESFIPGLYFPTGVASDGNQLVWVDHGPAQNQIGRAQIGSAGAVNRQDTFVSEPGGPWGVALDALNDPTQTSVSCTPSTVLPGSATSCTATVADSASSAPPAGPVIFSSNGTTFFSGSSSSCALTPRAGGASCVIGVVPLNAGTVPINAAYDGDSAHGGSSGSAAVCAGTATQCATGPPPPPPPPPPAPKKPTPSCLVPRLAGKTLAQAQKLLKSAHCALGRVTRPRAKRGHKLRPLVVGAQHFKAGRKLAIGTKVALGLVERRPAPRKRKHR